MSVEQLMPAALNKYELKVEDNSWSIPDKKDDRIIALEAENALLKTGKGNKKKKQAPRGSNAGDQYAWKKVPPKSGDPSKKKVNTKWYHWFQKHSAWTIHAPDACHLPEANDSEGGPPVKDEQAPNYSKA
jgi:hypothetical protein